MTNQSGVFAQGAIGCALLLVTACSSTTINDGGQGGKSSTNPTTTGGSSASSSSGVGGETGGSSSVQSTTQATGGQGTGGQTTGAGQGGVNATGGRTNGTTSVGQGGIATGGKSTGPSTGGKAATGGQTSQTTTSPATGGAAAGGQAAGGNNPGGGGSVTGGTTGAATGGKTSAAGGQAGSSASGGQSSSTGGGSGIVSGCVGGKTWPTANPAAAGPFQVQADKNVGPLAGYTPDPIYGDQQQRFNVYRPKNLADSGYCHPILIWANGHTDNPEPNPPLCVVDSQNNKWCGQYLPMMNHLASHGFVVVASLSTTTSRGEPLPTIAGLDWIIQQSEDSTSPYYHRLDTANIGQLGHSEGGMSTCMVASEPRYKALMSICGTRTLSGVHTPMLFFCGGKDTTVACSGVHDTFLTVTNQPAFFMNEKDSDHGKWVYGGANGPSLSGAAAWFRVHLMDDTANRKYFYGANCTFCTDSRVVAEQNSLMSQ